MRLIFVSYMALVHFVLYPLNSLHKDSFGTRLRKMCEKLGITYIKIGQALSMRYDLLSEEDCEELQKLLDKTNPLPYEVIRDILDREFRGPYTKHFKEFDKKPLGSASVSQVHKAVLHDGRVVAVKVKRPYVVKHVKDDMRIIKSLTILAMTFSPTLRKLRALESVRFFEKWILQDIDFILEAQNIRAIKEQNEEFKDDIAIVSPDVIFELCTKDIIVMDFVDGIPLTRKKELLSHSQYDPKKSVKRYVKTAMKTWFHTDSERESYLFQADPHLSNILALPHGGVANIDCGLVCSLTKKEADVFINMTTCIYLKDTKGIARIVSKWTKESTAVCLQRLQADLDAYFEKIDDEGMGFWFFEITKIFVKHNVRFPSFLIVLGRANTVLEGILLTYFPNYKLVDLLDEELKARATFYFEERMRNDVELLRRSNAVLEWFRDDVKDVKTFLTAVSDFSSAFQGKYKEKYVDNSH